MTTLKERRWDITMGNLKPGATYEYEHEDGVTYAREMGSDPSTRFPVGWRHSIDPRTIDGRSLHDHIIEDKLWGDIRRAAKDNHLLQDALNRAKVIYELSKQNGTEQTR